MKTPKGKLGFQTGDKVCVRKNNVCFDNYAKKEVKVSNGDIFFIEEVIDEEDNRNLFRSERWREDREGRREDVKKG